MRRTTGNSIAARALALLLVMLLCAAILGTFSQTAWAAPSKYDGFYVTHGADSNNSGVVSYIGNGDYVDIEFYFVDVIDSVSVGDILTADNFSTNNSYWRKTNNSTLTLKIESAVNSATSTYEVAVTLTNVQYRRTDKRGTLEIRDIKFSSTGSNYSPSIKTEVPLSYFSRSSSDDVEEEIPYTSKILIDKVYVRDKDGNVIDKVTKDSDPVTIEVIFADRGLRDVDTDDFISDEFAVYLTNTGGFSPNGGTKGTLTKMIGSTDGLPRFRAVFNHMEYKGGSNVISFHYEYGIYGWYVEGESGNVVVHQASEDEDDKMKPLTPHIIVSQYSYGGEAIAAGEEFTLSMTVRNTSSDIPLDNIVMMISPETIKSDTASSTTGGLTITSSSNSYYIERLEAGGTLSHSISLRAEPNAAVGSHKVDIKFSFQYVDDANKTREGGEDSESIAIPVTQIDRFSVDPITDYTETVMLGDEGYVIIGFINKGKSTTYNVTGTITGENLVNNGQSVHYSDGNLDAGKSGSIEIPVQPVEAGTVSGIVTIQYEDDNTNQKEVEVPFLIYVEEPYYPPAPPPGGMGDPGMVEPSGPNKVSIALCLIGGIAIAIPLMLYIIKWVEAKGKEEFDEIF